MTVFSLLKYVTFAGGLTHTFTFLYNNCELHSCNFNHISKSEKTRNKNPNTVPPFISRSQHKINSDVINHTAALMVLTLCVTHSSCWSVCDEYLFIKMDEVTDLKNDTKTSWSHSGFLQYKPSPPLSLCMNIVMGPINWIDNSFIPTSYWNNWTYLRF